MILKVKLLHNVALIRKSQYKPLGRNSTSGQKQSKMYICYCNIIIIAFVSVREVGSIATLQWSMLIVVFKIDKKSTFIKMQRLETIPSGAWPSLHKVNLGLIIPDYDLVPFQREAANNRLQSSDSLTRTKQRKLGPNQYVDLELFDRHLRSFSSGGIWCWRWICVIYGSLPPCQFTAAYFVTWLKLWIYVNICFIEGCLTPLINICIWKQWPWLDPLYYKGHLCLPATWLKYDPICCTRSSGFSIQLINYTRI